MSILRNYKRLGILFWVFAFSGCSYFNFNQQNRADLQVDQVSLIESGKAAFKQRRYVEAQSIFIKITRRSDTDISAEPTAQYREALSFLAQSYEKTGEPEKAILAWNELKNLKSSDAETQLALISLLKNQIQIQNMSLVKSTAAALKLHYATKNLNSRDVFENLVLATDFNYDHRMHLELEFISHLQYLLLDLIIGREENLGLNSTEYLMALYSQFFDKIRQDLTSATTRRKISAMLLDQIQSIKKQLTGNDGAASKKMISSSFQLRNELIKWLYK